MSYIYNPRRALGDIAQVADSGPYFLPDIYEPDLGASPNFDALAANPNVVGCILKATQGVSYMPPWFAANWPRAKLAGGDRYGSSWFRGAYHFGTPEAPGDAQADYFLTAIDLAGGWDSGDMATAWDLESSKVAWSSKQQVIDISSAFADRIKSQTGKAPLLYTGAMTRDMGITDHMGFDKMWSPHLDMLRASWPLEQFALWQYCGDGGKGYDLRSSYPGGQGLSLPLSIDGWGGTDMNVVMDGGRFAADIGAVRSILTGGGGLMVPLLLGAGALLLYLLSKRHSGEHLL